MEKRQSDGADKAPSVAKTLSVPDAGRIYFELGTSASYAAARRGEIPTIRIGGILRVPIIALERMLETAGQPEKPEGTS